MSHNTPTAESNLRQLKRQLAAERADDDSIPSPDRSSAAFARQRPLRSGCAVGSEGSGYGTLGYPVRVETTTDTPDWMHWDDSVTAGDQVLTTNRHVLDGDLGQAVYQPGHRTSDENRVGEVVGYAELDVSDAPDIAFFVLDDAVEWDGYLADRMGESVHHGDPEELVGQDSRLFGATSGAATGTVEDGTTTLHCNYGARGVIEKRGVIRATDNSRGGDSGSPSDGGPGGAIQGNNFASSEGFLEGGGSWRVPVRLVEQCGVRVLSNSDRESMSTRNRDGHIVAIEGHGTHVNYTVSAGRLWATEARGGQVNPDDTISGEPGEGMQASGHVTSGVDPYGYHGTRSLDLSLADGSVPTADDVTVWVRPKGEDWIDWTAETLAQQQPEGPTIEERKARLAEAGRATDVGEIHDSQDFADAFEFIGEFIGGDLGYVLADGEYSATDADKEHPPGAFHSTFLPAIPSYSVKYVGNFEDPSATHVTSPVALIDLAYDEHVRFDGIRFESVQVARGDAMFVDCRIRDLGGKPSGGRFNNCSIGGQDVDRAGRWYGGGEVYLDHGTEVVVADDAAAYFTAPNNCSLLVRGSVEFSDPDKPLFDDARSITPAGLGGGINELPPDHDAAVYS